MSSEQSPLLRAKSSSYVLRDQLKKSCGDDGKLQKSEFKVLLLARGIDIKQAVLDDIFAECDKDGDGSLTVDEIFGYVDNAKPKTFCDGINYAAHQATSSIVWWFSVAFHFAAWVSVVSYFFKHFLGRSIRPEWGIVSAWFFFTGAIYFLKRLLDRAGSSYDTMIQAKTILKHSVEKDPTFFHKKAGEDGSLDKPELNAAFEENNLYLPKSTLTQIFAEIDADKSGHITEDEILAFAKSQNIDPTVDERQAAINDAVSKSWGFYSLLCWFIGSILFLAAAHLSYAGITEPPLPHHTYYHLYGMGSVLYFALAVFMLPSLRDEATDYLESIQHMSQAFADRSRRHGLTSDEQLFEHLDVRRSFTRRTGDSKENESDGNLDVTELYDALLDGGVLIPHDTFLELFKSADESGDGELQLKEFAKFIKNFELIDLKDGYQYAYRMTRRAPFCPCFFGTFMFFVGGIFYILGSYVDLQRGGFWFFAGAVCYFCASFRGVFETLKNHFAHFQEVEAGKFQFIARCASDVGRDAV